MSIFITMDTDWASPDTLDYVFSDLIDHRLPLTIFCTQLYESVKSRSHTEKALHYTTENGGIEHGFSDIARQVPGAVGVRGHSLAISERLRPLYSKNGIRYDSSYMMFEQQGITPFPIARNVWELPIYFMDFFFLEYHGGDFNKTPTRYQLEQPGLKIFDFHPVHLLLNTPTVEYYQSLKHFYHDTRALLKHRYQGWGVASFFKQVQAIALTGSLATLSEVANNLKLPSQQQSDAREYNSRYRQADNEGQWSPGRPKSAAHSIDVG